MTLLIDFETLRKINSNLLFLSLPRSFPGTHAGSHEKRLLHHLLDNYNVLERPVANESDPLQLSFGLTLMQIIDVVSIFPFPFPIARGAEREADTLRGVF